MKHTEVVGKWTYLGDKENPGRKAILTLTVAGEEVQQVKCRRNQTPLWVLIDESGIVATSAELKALKKKATEDTVAIQVDWKQHPGKDQGGDCIVRKAPWPVRISTGPMKGDLVHVYKYFLFLSEYHTEPSQEIQIRADHKYAIVDVFNPKKPRIVVLYDKAPEDVGNLKAMLGAKIIKVIPHKSYGRAAVQQHPGEKKPDGKQWR